MKEWVEKHLLTEAGNKLSAKRINEKWFIKHGFKEQYESLISIHQDLTLACKIVIGWTSICKCCQNIVIKPRVYCSTKCQVNDPKWKEEKKQIMLSKYGVENAFQSGDLRETFEQKNIEIYGSRFPIETKEVREKAKNTCLTKYGVENVFQSKLIQDKIKNVLIEKYGVDNPQKIKSVRIKTKITNLKKYGFESASKNEKVKQKSIETNLKRYGVEHSSKLKVTQEKKIQTNLKKYGVEQTNQSHFSKELLEAIDNKLIDVMGQMIQFLVTYLLKQYTIY